MGIKELKEQLASNPFFSSPVYLRYKQFIVPGIVLVIAILISMLVTIPQFLRLFETFKNISDLNQQKEFLQNKVAALQTLDQVQYQKDLDIALMALPVDKNIPGVTGEILVALSGSGMSMDGLTFANAPLESEKVEEFTLRLEVTGTQESLSNFLERVKLTPRLIRMTSVDVGKTKSGLVSASVGFVTLYQQLPKKIGAVEEPVPQITAADTQVLADIKSKAGSISSESPADLGGSGGSVGKLNPFAP